jgi:hypothetical protein
LPPVDPTLDATLAYLDSTPSVVRSLIEDIDGSDLRRHPEGTGWTVDGHHFEWSLLQHLCHWRDLECEAYGLRIDRLQREVEPFLPDWDGDRVAAKRDYDAEDAASAIADFESARRANVAAARAALASGRLRRGEMEGVGKVTVVELLGFMQVHDRGHVAAVQQLRDFLRRGAPHGR